MKATVACCVCLLDQAYNTARHSTDDPDLQKKIIDETMRRYLQLDDPLSITPGELSQIGYEVARELTGVHDPYATDKCESNEAALELYPDLKRRVEQSQDPVRDALLLAVAGNIIDLGIAQEYDLTDDVVGQIERGFDVAELEGFLQAIAGAGSILYVADNSGEIVFDRLLIEHLGPDRVTVMVKGRPIVNDATIDDARQVGLTDLVRVVDTGSNYFGFPWDIVSEAARDEFRGADLILSKGHANFETISELSPDWTNVWYLLKVKCAEVANVIDADVGDVVLLSHDTVKASTTAD